MSFEDWKILRELKEHFLATVEMAYVFDENSALLLTKDDRVYGLGGNTKGCLGLGSADRRSYGLPTEILSLRKKKIKGVTRGGYTAGQSAGLFVVAHSHSGQLYWWGCIPFTNRILYHPEKIATIDLKIVVKTVACGASHCVILSVDGKVFTCGQNNVGQLGHSTNQLEVEKLVRVKGQIESKTVIDISCGYEFTAVLLDYGKVCTWGSNTSGQLGINCRGGKSVTPVGVSSLRIYYQVAIKKIACGRDHVLALSKSGTLYAWGSCLNGQLGIENISGKYGCPLEVEMNNERIADIDASYQCRISVAQSENGKVYMWGDTSKGIIKKPRETDCGSVDHVFASYARPKIMLRPLKLKKIRIHVKDLLGKNFHIFVENTDSVIRMKELIQEADGLPVDQQRLIFSGRQLEDKCTVQDYQFKEESIIHVVQKLRGD